MKANIFPGLVLILFMIITGCEPNENTIPVEGISLDYYERNLEIDTQFQLTAGLNPKEATNKSVDWQSSAAGVASVDQAGLVTAVSEGTAVITATSEDGGYEAYCTVTVTGIGIPVTSISLETESDTLDIDCTLQLTASFEPQDATNRNITWSTSDASVAAVNSDGQVNAVSGGTVTITATSEDGSFTASCEILVLGRGSITEAMTKGLLKSCSDGGGGGVGVDMVCDASGQPYLGLVAYDASLASGSKASTEVWHYDGSNWSQFGSRVAVTDDEAYAPGLAIGASGEVYISFKEFETEGETLYDANVVAHSTGTDWTLVGLGGGNLIMDGTSKLNRGSELAFKEDGTLLIANMYYGAGYVHYFDGTNWKSYNGYKTNNTDSFWGGGIDIQCLGNKPFVSIRTSSGTGKTGVLYGNETNGVNGQWEWLAGSYANTNSQDCSFLDEKVSDASMAISANGDLFTAYKAYVDGSYRVFVKKMPTGESSWTQIYSQETDDVEQVDVVLSGEVLYLLVATYDKGIDIYKLNSCGTWVHEGTTAKPDTYYNFDVAPGIDGIFYIGYECTYNSAGQVGVFKYTPCEE